MMRSALLAALACILAACGGNPWRHGRYWEGAWEASPTVPRPDARGYEQQTLRLLVHPTHAGDSVRIRVCNTFGKQPVEIGEVSIAFAATGPATVHESARSIRFEGRAGTTIAPGAAAMSDPVAFPLESDRTVAVSLYLPSSTGPATVHP